MASTDFEKLKGDKKIPFKTLMQRILKYVKPEVLSFIFALIFMIFSVFLTLVFPMIIKGITNELYKGINSSFAIVIGLAIAYFVMNIAAQGFIYIQSMITKNWSKNYLSFANGSFRTY